MNQNILDKLINVNEKRILKRSFFWNMIASILNGFTSAIFLFFITRFCGLNEAGIFSIASAIAYQCISLGNFGTRGVHASDVKEEFSFCDYFYVRIFSYLLLLMMLLYYAFGSGYSLDKSLVILSYGLFKSIDVIEDLYHGEYHRRMRLDIAAILLTFRYLISIVCFIVIVLFTDDMFIASIISFVLSLLIFIFTNKNVIHYFYNKKYKFSFGNFKKLLYVLIPVVLTTYIKMYINNSPKYAIDACLGNIDQAYFNVLYMPVFVIGLMCDIIFRPYIPLFSNSWNTRDFREFKTLLFRQIFVIIGITVAVILGGYIIGLTLLELIYGVQLHQFMISFMLLLIGGGLNTLYSYLTVVMTVIRSQKKMAFVNIIVFAVCLIIMNPLVRKYEIFGATLISVTLNLIAVILSSIIVLYDYFKYKKMQK